ncbi:MAG TPA: type II secretion system protein [Xanthomonadales bacterium]|nr:type II secretion system protein [Xanthomonadales bacterium]
MINVGKIHSPRTRSGGFTLLEVLLAFVIFSISFAVVLQIISGSIRNTMRSKQFTEVALIAQSVMDTVGLDIPLEMGSESSGDSGDYRWELRVMEYEPTEDPENISDALVLAELTGIELLQVELLVIWGDPSDERSRRFSTVRAMMANRAL